MTKYMKCRDAEDFLSILIMSSYDEMSWIIGEKWGNAVSATKHYYQAIFDTSGGAETAKATRDFLISITAGHPLETDEHPVIVPKNLLNVFEQAFKEGAINAVAWGSALRTIVTAGAIDTPDWYLPDIVVNKFEGADPRGLMTANELDRWRKLPETVTLYRGGCTRSLTEAGAVNELRRGIHWTPFHNVAESYMRARCQQRYGMPNCGLPALIRADVPRSLIIADLTGSGQMEMLVDFRGIERDSVVDLGALTYPEGKAIGEFAFAEAI